MFTPPGLFPPLSIADATLSSCIFFGICVSLWAVSRGNIEGATTSSTATPVFCARYSLQVVWIYARSISAEVIYP